MEWFMKSKGEEYGSEFYATIEDSCLGYDLMSTSFFLVLSWNAPPLHISSLFAKSLAGETQWWQLRHRKPIQVRPELSELSTSTVLEACSLDKASYLSH
jgi:hypothetical protein